MPCEESLAQATAMLQRRGGGASRTLTLVGVQEKGASATAHIQSRANDQSTLIGDETALFVRDQDRIGSQLKKVFEHLLTLPDLDLELCLLLLIGA